MNSMEAYDLSSRVIKLARHLRQTASSEDSQEFSKALAELESAMVAMKENAPAFIAWCEARQQQKNRS